MLTVLSIRAEEGRKRELDGEGWSSAGMAMAAGALEVDSAKERLNSRSSGAVVVRGEVEEVGARGIKLRRRGLAGTRSGRGTARTRLCSRREKGERRSETGDGTGMISTARLSVAHRDGRRVESSPAATAAVWRRGGTGEALESTVITFKDFDSILVN